MIDHTVYIAGPNITAADYTLTAGGTTLAGLTGEVTLSATQTSVALTLTAVDDADTSVETLTFTLGAGTGYTVATSAATITINPVAVAVVPALSVAAAPTTIGEGAASTITITAATAPAGDLTIPFTIAGPNITAADYTLTAGATTLAGLTGEVTLSATQTSVELTLTAADDADTSAETLTFTLDTPSGTDYTLTTATATITIDPAAASVVPALSVAADLKSIVVGGPASTLTITASSAPAGDLTIPYTIAGEGITADDYTLSAGGTALAGLTGDVILSAGQTSVELTLTAAADADADVEILAFTLAPPVLGAGYTVATSLVSVRINPPLNLTVEFSEASISFNELSADSNATNQVTFDVELSELLRGGATVEIPVVTTAGTATAGTDYTTLSTMLTFTAGSTTSQRVSIEIASDELYETDETFTVGFGALPSGVTAGTVSVVTVTIDDDDTLTVDFAGGIIRRVNENAGPLEITMRLSAVPGVDVSIPYNVRAVTATYSTDFNTPSGNLNGNMAMFTVESGSREAVLSFPIERDMTDEPNNNETFQVNFTGVTLPPRVQARASSGGTVVSIVQILDENPALSISAAHSVIGSGRTGTEITIEVNNGITPLAALQIPFAISGLATRAGSSRDYTLTDVASDTELSLLANSVTLAPGAMIRWRMDLILDADDRNEDAIFTLATPGSNAGYTVSTRTATVVISGQRDVRFTSAAATVNEGNSVTVGIISGGPNQADDDFVFMIPIVITGGTATDADYTTSALIVELPSGTIAGSVTIDITDDDIYESSETLTLALGDLSGMGLQTGNIPSTTVTITDNDTLSVSFVDATPTVSEGAGTATVEVRLTGMSAVPVTLDVATAPGTPAAGVGGDYRVESSTVTFTPPATTATVMLTIIDNQIIERDERFELSLENPNPAARVTLPAPAVITITDDDFETLSVIASPGTIEEGEISTITITASTAPLEDRTVSYTISGVAADDYTLSTGGTMLPEGLTGEVTLPSGERSVALMLTAINDADGTETLTFTLAAGNYTVSDRAGAATVTINPLVQRVQFTELDLEVAEDAGMVPVTVELTLPADGEIMIPIMTADDTAMAAANADYTAVMTDVVIADGATTGTVNITITNDNTREAIEETFTVSLGTLPAGVMAGVRNQQLTVSILDDDGLTIPGFSAATMNVDEDAGTLAVVVDVSQTGGAGLPAPLDIRYTWTAGTAEVPVDFDPVPAGLRRTVSLDAGTTMFTVRATITDDDIVDANEMMTLRLFATGAGVMITTPVLTITIIDDDGTAPVLSVAAAPTAIAEGATSTITITANTAPADDLTIPFTIGGTNIEASDYTLTGATNVTGLAGNIILTGSTTSVALTLMAADDADVAAEMLTFTLDAPANDAGYTLRATNTATITIDPAGAPANTMPTVEFSEATLSVMEDVSGGMATVTVQLSTAVTGGISIPIATATGTATGVDYTALAADAMVTFTGTETSQTISIPINDDALVEPDEEFTVSLGMIPDGAMAGATETVTVTIDSDDIGVVEFEKFMGDSLVEIIMDGRSSYALGVHLSNVDTLVGSTTVIPLVFTDDTAIAGTDYTAVTSVTIMPADVLGHTGNGTNLTIPLMGAGRFTISFGDLPTDITASTTNGTFTVIFR